MSWSPDPAVFLEDLEAKPVALRALADALDAADPWAPVVATRPSRIVFLGMGSSRFAALRAASRLRAAGVAATAEYASAVSTGPTGPDTLVVGVSASGGTPETVEALAAARERGAQTVALTNVTDAPLAAAAKDVVDLAAGPEPGGVACRTFQHTLVLLDALAASVGAAPPPAPAVRSAAVATDALLADRDTWLPETTELLAATGRAFVLGPAERISSAEQGALMLREGPRLHADACESGDWLHVDVYLTEPLDYRAVLFTGSRFDDEILGWCEEREATVVGVGAGPRGVARTVRYPHDDDEAVAALTEILVPELVAQRIWASRATGVAD